MFNKMISSKQLKINQRKSKLVDLAEDNLLFCKYNEYTVIRQTIERHHCYNKKNNYCKYLEFLK